MPIMEWDRSLDIGVGAMNHEHRQILDAMNRIHDATQAGRVGEEINRLVDQLGTICVLHFKDEEQYMSSIGFPGLKNHAFIHRELLDRFGRHAAEIKAAGGSVDPAFFQFLRHWLGAHIKGIDRKYADYSGAGLKVA